MVNLDPTSARLGETGQSKSVRVRFAPSPTGFVHIGSLRTALFNFLFARHANGKLILRIEDTDQTRSVEGAIENLLKVMKQLGIEFDEGPYLDEIGLLKELGKFGPYLQSKRLEIYKKYAQGLIELGSAYYCFCDEARLEQVKKEQIALKKPPMYDRHCRNLSKEEVDQKLSEFKKEGKNPVIRQAIPTEGQTVVHDMIYGDINFDHKVLDDQVLLKSDGFPTYHLAVVIDDHFMEISHVIRGEEWISSTPKHLLLYKALSWQPTKFAHLPLIVNPDKSKLSKRQGDVAVEDFLAKGYLKEALLNFVAFLGWNPKTEKEIFSLDDLIQAFELTKINKAAAVLDTKKLDWINGRYIRTKSVEELTELLIPFWQKENIDISKFEKKYLQAITTLEKDRLKKLSEIGERTKYFFVDPEYPTDLLIWKDKTAQEIKNGLQAIYDFLEKLDESILQNQSDLEKKIKTFIEESGFENGGVLWPFRVALTGLDASPSPFEIASTIALGLGKEEILKRIRKATEKLDK
jgi:glutamyl-tRNA synthetase